MRPSDFFLDLGFMVIVASAIAFLGHRVRLPSVLAYLLAGMFLGPVTGWIEVSETLHLISEVGVVLLLFLVGLELRWEKIKDVGHIVLLTGAAQVGGTWLLATLFISLFGFSWFQAFLMGACLTFSSTAVVVKLLKDHNQMEHLFGRVTLGILLTQDLAVILLLTFLNSLDGGEAIQLSVVALNLFKAFGGLGLMVVGLWLCVHYILPGTFKSIASSSETLFVWSLCWCFALVWVAHLFHLSVEAGAFLAGFSLAQLPYHEDLHQRVHPLQDFFLAVFFVSLGIEIQFPKEWMPWLLALAFSFFTLVVKPILLMLTMRWFRYGPKTSFFTSNYLGQISEFSLVLAGLCAREKHGDFLSLMALTALITISLSSYNIQRIGTTFTQAMRFRWLRNWGASDPPTPPRREYENHIILVGLNSLGRKIIQKLHDRGETVLAIDTDHEKLNRLPCLTMIGNIHYHSVLEAAGLPKAKMLISALRIEDANDWLAYRAQYYNIPCSVCVVDMNYLDHLLEANVAYLMIPKVDGIKLQTSQLREMEYLPKQPHQP